MFPIITGQQYILQIQNIFVETVYILELENFWKICSTNIYDRVSNFLIYDQKKVILKC